MEILELARLFGENIKETPELRAYYAAKAEYDADAPLQNRLLEYEAQRRILSEAFDRPTDEQDKDLIETVRARLSALASEIAADDCWRDYEAAKRSVNDLMQRVNGEISAVVFGRRPAPDACTHDCSTCAGCSSRNADDAE